jgi:hypothetical protein
LQHPAVLQDGLGIKCFFDQVTLSSEGKTKVSKSYSPVKGDIISP